MNTLDTVKQILAGQMNGQSGQAKIELPEFTREYLAWLFKDLGFFRGAEIGVHKGYYSEILCKANPGLDLISVDIWDKPEIYLEASRRLREYYATLLRMPSVEAAQYVADGWLDFIYIDGNHTRPAVTEDLNAWIPKVKKGGIIAGHDYKIATNTAAARRCKVVEAVNDYVAAHKIEPLFIIGTSPKIVPWPSWFWVNE